jgi:hypothetical protein
MQLLIDVRTGRHGPVEQWVDAFAALWRGGRSCQDDFMSLFGPQVRLSAPGLKSTTGHAAGAEAFRKTFAVFPDLTATVERWATGADVLFIEMEFSATLGGKPTRWRGVDRFDIRDGVVVARMAFLNPLRVRRALLRRPRGWVQMLAWKHSGL